MYTQTRTRTHIAKGRKSGVNICTKTYNHPPRRFIAHSDCTLRFNSLIYIYIFMYIYKYTNSFAVLQIARAIHAVQVMWGRRVFFFCFCFPLSLYKPRCSHGRRDMIFGHRSRLKEVNSIASVCHARCSSSSSSRRRCNRASGVPERIRGICFLSRQSAAPRSSSTRACLRRGERRRRREIEEKNVYLYATTTGCKMPFTHTHTHKS